MYTTTWQSKTFKQICEASGFRNKSYVLVEKQGANYVYS